MGKREDFEIAVARLARAKLRTDGWVFLDQGDWLRLAAEVGLSEVEAQLAMRGLESRGLIRRNGRHYTDPLPLILALEVDADRTAFYESNDLRRELLSAAADAGDDGASGVEYTDGSDENFTSRPWSEAAAAAQALQALGLGSYQPTMGEHFYFSANIDGYSLARDPAQLAEVLPTTREEDPMVFKPEHARAPQADAAISNSGARPLRAFISSSHQDGPFALDLHRALAKELNVWIDEVDLKIGESLTTKISAAILEGDYVIALITEHSVRSEWCRKELSLAVNDGINRKRVKVLPVVFDRVEVPAELADVKQLRLDPQPNADDVAAQLLSAMRKLNRSFERSERTSLSGSPDPDHTRGSASPPRWEILRTDGAVSAGSRTATAYLWWIRRGEDVRPVTVFVTRAAQATDDRSLPSEVVQAKKTKGRSVITTLLGDDSPPREIMVPTSGVRPIADES